MPIPSSAGKENKGSAPYGRLRIAIKFLWYYLTASNGKGHGVHSPFVFDFIKTILLHPEESDLFDRLEQTRRELLQNNTLIEVEDFGAGSSALQGKQRSIASIAATSLKHPRYSRLMHLLVARYQPRHIIELGTSLGITTAYMASAAPEGRVITVEGSQAIADEAARHFEKSGFSNIHLVRGRFDEKLEDCLQESGKADLVFIDGDHRLHPTLDYFKKILPYTHGGSILVFDDIHWSPQMEEAWETIRSHPSVRLSIDIFFLGLVFFSPGIKEKQHFTLRY